MLTWIIGLAGSQTLKRLLLPVGIVLGAILISFVLIQYGKSIQETENQAAHGEAYIETTERVNSAVESVNNSDANSAREWLQQRQRRNQP